MKILQKIRAQVSFKVLLANPRRVNRQVKDPKAKVLVAAVKMKRAAVKSSMLNFLERRMMTTQTSISSLTTLKMMKKT